MSYKLFLIGFIVNLFCAPLLAADYYWVGGSGLWSEVNGHWATTSGGTTYYSIVPTSTDNVIFDENSFTAAGQSVTIDGNFVNCLSMDWSKVTNNPEFKSNVGGTLYVFGSLTLNDNMTVNLNSDVVFQSPQPAQTIYSGGNRLTNTNIAFNNANGGWSLLDSLNVGVEINHKQGALITNGHSVVASKFIASDGVTLNMENSTFHMDVNYQSNWSAYGTTSIINAANSTIYAYSVGVGVGYTFNDIYVTTRSVYGDSAQIQNLTFLNSAEINLTNTEVQHLTVLGSQTKIDRGPNYFHKAEIASETVNFPTPAWYQDYMVDQEFDSLIFSTPGVVVSMGASVQKINNHLYVAADCENYSEIKSDNLGSPIQIEIPVDVTLEYLRLTDVHISGGATYTLTNAVDNGGNAGWNLNEGIAKDLYWIGTSSNDWNDGNNWSLSSGGSPYGCSPTIKDNVFFDANSFSKKDTVDIVSAAFANNVDWTGAGFTPLLKGNKELNIGGSLKMNSDVVVSNYGAVNFISCELGNTIQLFGVTPTRGNINFNCPEGEWKLLDSLITEGQLSLTNGSLIAEQVKISADLFYVLDSTTLSLANSELELTYYDGWEIGKGVQLDAATTEFHMNSGQYYSIPQFQGGTGYTYGSIYLESDPTYTYSISCTSCQIDSIIGVTGKGNLSIIGTTIDYVKLVSSNGIINSNGSVIKELVVNTTEQMQFNTINSTSYKKLTVESLEVLNPAVEFVLRDTLEVTNILSIPSNCNTFFSIKSLSAGTPAYLIAPDNLMLEFVSIQDIIVGNGSNYQANNSIDKGGNTNWQFTALEGKKLYWVGGEGNWDIGDNWSLTSGGTPLGCVPSPLDTVVFDENSFDQVGQTVTVSAGINISTMDWSAVTNTPVFSTTGDLNFNGSLIYSENMEVNTPSSYLFNSCNSGNIIQTGNHQLTDHYDYDISFNCSTGSWSLQDSLKLMAELKLNKGSLITNGNTLYVRGFEALDNTGLDIRNSDIIVTYDWALEGSDIDFKAEGSYIRSTYSTFKAGEGYDYWNVEFLRGSGYSPPSITGNNLTFHKLILDDVVFNANNSLVDSLVIKGIQASISGTGNKYVVADLNSTNSVTILRDQEFDILNVNTSGLNVIFQSGKTQTVNKELNIIQEPSFPIYFSATTQGTQANINFLGSKPPCSEFLFLRDNNIYGPSGVPFYAGLDSDDIDNNTGWLFETNADCNTLLCDFEGIALDLGDDIPLFCVQHKFKVTPLSIPVDYQWQTLSGVANPKGSLTEFTITESATVVLTLSTDICTISDTVVATKGDCSVLPLQICEGDSILLKPSISEDAHQWNTGSSQDSIYVNTTGFYWVDNDNGAGIVVRDSFYVAVNTYPQLNLGEDTLLCNASYSYTLSSDLDNFLWSFGGTNPSYTTDTSAQVWVEVTKDNCAVRDSITIVSDKIDFTGFGRTDTTLCSLNDTIQYNLVLTNLNYLWENGDTGFESGQKNITTPGIYWVEVFSDLGCKIRDSIQVNLSDIEPIDLGNDTLLCNEEVLDLAINSVYDATFWSDGGQDYDMSVNTMGKYWAAGLKGSCFVSDTIIVNKVVVSFGAGLGADTTLCDGDSLYWKEALPTGLSYVWENGASGSSQLERTIKDQGIYWLEIESYGCTSRDSIQVNVANTANFSLGKDTVLCDGAALTLSVPNTYSTYMWSDGSVNNELTVSVSDEYWVKATSGSCTVTDTIQVNAYISPSFDLGADTTLCIGDSLRLYANITGHYFEWENGNSGIDLVDRTLKEAGTFWLEIGQHGCDFRDSIKVEIAQTIDSGLGGDTVLCAGNSIVLNASNSFDSYKWQDGSVNAAFTVSSEGKYWVELTKEHCTTTDSIVVSLVDIPEVFIGEDTLLCPGETLKVQKAILALSYKWQDGISGTNLIDRTINTAGVYWVEIGQGNCKNRDSITVSIANVPTSGLGADTILCTGNNMVLNANSSFDVYEWQDGSSTPSFTVSSEGKYWVKLTKGNCEIIDTVLVGSVVFPEIFPSKDTSLCNGQTIVVEETFPNFSFEWENGLNGFEDVYREIDQSGVYWLELSSGLCSTRDTMVINSVNVPDFTIGNDTSICSMETVLLTIPQGFSNPVWDNGSTSTNFLVDETGVYSVNAFWGNCPIYDDIQVLFKDDLCPEDPLVFPTAFTPNGDGINDTWVIDGLDKYPNSSLEIFNRWGKLIFQSENYYNQWSGDDLPMGTYYYAFRHDDSSKQITGTVTIIRLE